MAFLFAPAHHPALKHAAQARRELGTRTIFNILGPLANPALATHQLLGMYDDALRPVAARVLRQLGVRRAWIVRGHDGLDEVSPCAPTRVSELTDDGRLLEREVSPEDFGTQRVGRAAIMGSDAAENAHAIRTILSGAPHPAREAVVLNAAAALVVATGDPPRTAAERARRAIDEGAARTKLEDWRQAAERART
jgi:anthranilate phosphoribosyltransferase